MMMMTTMMMTTMMIMMTMILFIRNGKHGGRVADVLMFHDSDPHSDCE